MTFLPIVDRELRTRVRRRSTFWWRTIPAAFAMLVASGIWFTHGLFSPGGLPGSVLLTALAWMAFGFSLLEGIRHTADCLSEEKRAGTLGLLFLTDLRGYDVVLGKVVAAGLNSLYGLLAILPMLALSLLLGGVTGGEFGRMALALVNTLWGSLALGLLASTFSREASHAWARAFGLLAGWLGAPWVVLGTCKLLALGLRDAPSAWVDGLLTAGRWISFVSPLAPFSSAFAAGYARNAGTFWFSLTSCHALGWLCVAVASRFLPHRWQDAPAVCASPALDRPASATQPQTLAEQAAGRAGWLERNPVTWLALQGSASPWAIWALTTVGLLCCAVIALLLDGTGFVFGSWFLLPVELAFKIWLAFEACRVLGEARKSGALELLLVTPLTSRELLHGLLRALSQRFLWPAVSLSAGYAVFFVVPPLLWGTGRAQLPSSWWFHLNGLNHAVGFCTSLVAIAYVGLRLTLSLKRPGQAAGLTLLGVVLVPAFVLCLPNVLAHVAFIVWASSKLERDFRQMAAESLAGQSGG